MDDMPSRYRNALLAEKDGSRQNQNRGIYAKRDRQGHHGIKRIEMNRATNGQCILLKVTALYQRRVQVKIVRHNGGADNADGDV